MLVGLAVLLALSLWMTTGIESVAPGWVGPILAALVNLVMSAGLLVAVPRLRVTPQRMLTPVLLVGLGITLLTTVGRFYVSHTANNPAYRVVSAAAGLLVFLNLFSQLLLFGAALGATSPHGSVRDLAARRPSTPSPSPSPSPAPLPAPAPSSAPAAASASAAE